VIVFAFLGMAVLSSIPGGNAQPAHQEARTPLLSEEEQAQLKDAAATLHEADRAYLAGDYVTAELKANHVMKCGAEFWDRWISSRC